MMLAASDKANLDPQNMGLCSANGVPQSWKNGDEAWKKVSNATKAQLRVNTLNPTWQNPVTLKCCLIKKVFSYFYKQLLVKLALPTFLWSLTTQLLDHS